MIEVEILDDENEPRDFDDVVKEFRKRVIMQETGNITLKVKSHTDDMVSEVFKYYLSEKLFSHFREG